MTACAEKHFFAQATLANGEEFTPFLHGGTGFAAEYDFAGDSSGENFSYAWRDRHNRTSSIHLSFRYKTVSLPPNKRTIEGIEAPLPRFGFL
jgi:hypothetical protein